MDKKEIVVVIRGANYLRSDISFLQNVILFAYKIFNVVPSYEKTKEKWFSKLKNKNRELIYFNWSGKFWPWTVYLSSKRLKEVLIGKENVKIISCSLGTQIALKTLKNSKNIKKIISIAGVYRKINSGTTFIDLRAKEDYFGNFICYIFNFLSFAKMNTTTINLDGIRHDEFHNDKKIGSGTFKGKNISDLLNSYLK